MVTDKLSKKRNKKYKFENVFEDPYRVKSKLNMFEIVHVIGEGRYGVEGQGGLL